MLIHRIVKSLDLPFWREIVLRQHIAYQMTEEKSLQFDFCHSHRFAYLHLWFATIGHMFTGIDRIYVAAQQLWPPGMGKINRHYSWSENKGWLLRFVTNARAVFISVLFFSIFIFVPLKRNYYVNEPIPIPFNAIDRATTTAGRQASYKH